MNGTPVTVYVPCDVVKIQVSLGYGDRLSPMEELVLRAVHAGLSEVGQLAEVLGLGRRLVHDLIYDLWRQDRLVLDLETATVEVSAQVARCLERDELDRLRGAEVVPETRELMVDKLSGMVRPAEGFTRPPQSRMAVPVEDSDVRLQDATEEDILNALKRSLSRGDRDREGRPRDRTQGLVIAPRERRVLSYRIPPRDLQQVSGRRWVEVGTVPSWDEEAQRLVITVVDDRVPAPLREIASERLTQLAADFPRKAVFEELRRRAVGGLIDPPSAEGVLARLERKADGAADIPLGQRVNWHNELAHEARQLDGLLRTRVAREAQATPVSGEEHPNLVRRLIRKATIQLVIVGPWVTYPALADLLPELRAAADRGVRIAVLWGVSAEQDFTQLEERVQNALDDLVRGTPGRRQQILVPRTSARTHAKLLIADDRAALVTSRNLLSSGGRLSELGVLLEAPHPGECQTVTDLLLWARSVVPSYEHSRMLLVRHADFAESVRFRTGTAPVAADRDEPPEAQVLEPEEDESVAAASVRVWSEGWRAHAAACREFLSGRALPDTRRVTDVTHRSLLSLALRKAMRRLVITSDGLSAEVVDDGFAAALGACLDRGVEVTLVYGGKTAKGREAAQDRLEKLSRDHPERLRLVAGTGQGDDNHAKVLIWDDDVVVGSFNYLSFEGRYGRHRLSSELSVRLGGRRIADEVARAVGAAPSARPERALVQEAVPAVPVGAAYVAAQRILAGHRTDPAKTAGLVRDELAGAAQPWQVLDALREQAPPDLVRIIAARCLADHAATASDQKLTEWLDWLIADRWEAGAFVEAAVLRHGFDRLALRLRPGLAMLAAARRTSAFEQVLEDFVIDDPSSGERVVGVAAGVGAVLLSGSVRALEPLEICAEELSAGPPEQWPQEDADAWTGLWTELAERTVRYFREGGYQPVPLDLIRGRLGDARHGQAMADAWDTLDRLIEHAAAISFNNTTSKRTHHALFDSPSGEFARLRKVVDERSESRLRDWLDKLPTRDMHHHVTIVSGQVSTGRQVMEGHHLKRYLARLHPVLDQVGEVLRAHAAADGDTAAVIPASARTLAGWLHGNRERLAESAAALAAAEGRLAREFLEDLDELAQWGGQP